MVGVIVVVIVMCAEGILIDIVVLLVLPCGVLLKKHFFYARQKLLM